MRLLVKNIARIVGIESTGRLRCCGADMNKLFNIPARERIGRAKMVEQDKVAATFDEIIAEMKTEIQAVAEGGEDE